MAKVTIQYWAAAREAAGVELESVEARTLAEALDVIVARRGDDGRLRSVLARSSFLVDGAAAGHRIAADLVLPDAAVIEVLPQFAGGLWARARGAGQPPRVRGARGARGVRGGRAAPRARGVPGGRPPEPTLSIPRILRQTGWITPYSVRTSTFRSQHSAVPHHEPARISSGRPGTRGGTR